jgi:hypothetical protein
MARIASKSPAEEFCIVTTSPVVPLTLRPTSDAVALTQALHAVRVRHMGGSLATTLRIGRALLASDPDETIVLTDEPPPADLSEETVRWVKVGEPLANVAIVGLDAQGSLCAPADARVIATVQNFSDEATSVVVAATQRAQRFAEAGVELTPHARRSLSLAMPEGIEGWVDIALISRNDGLDVDNHAWIEIRSRPTRPIVIRARSPSFKQTVSTWLGACPALTWTGGPELSRETLVITDHEEDSLLSAAAAMVFLPPTSPRTVLSHWVVSSAHPIGSYLVPVEVVAAALNLSGGRVSGLPVISGLVNGRKVPIVVADEREGRRVVSLLLDPSGSDDSTPVLLAFFNSLRWLMGRPETQRTGEPVTIVGLKPGIVSVSHPDGSTQILRTEGSAFRYDAATLAGRYQFSQGPVEMTVAVNFFNPLESNLMDRVSTWHTLQGRPVTTAAPRRTLHPLSHPLIVLVLLVLLLEWWRYSARGTSTVHAPSRKPKAA